MIISKDLSDYFFYNATFHRIIMQGLQAANEYQGAHINPTEFLGSQRYRELLSAHSA
jgi:hypothetical protein